MRSTTRLHLNVRLSPLPQLAKRPTGKHADTELSHADEPMNQFIVASVTLGLVLGSACRSVPRDECERFVPAPSASTLDAKFITNVEPRSFLGVALDSVT